MIVLIIIVFQEVSDKGSKITQLENEKSALIRDLFNHKASSGKNGLTTKKSNKIFWFWIGLGWVDDESKLWHVIANIKSKNLFQCREWSAVLAVADKSGYNSLTNLMGLMYGDPAMNTKIFAVLNYEEDGVVYENAIVQFYIYQIQNSNYTIG